MPKCKLSDGVFEITADAAPENQTTTQGSSLVSQQSCPETQNSTKRTLEERRTSSLDHHWAVPKPKSSSDSVDAQTEIDRIQLGETARGVEGELDDLLWMKQMRNHLEFY